MPSDKVNEYDMPLLRPEPDRDGWGRYMLPNPAEPGHINSYTRATTVAKALDDTYNLNQYQKRLTAQGFKVKPELLDSIDLMQDDSRLRDTLQEVADEAYDAAGGNIASARGTQLHYFTEAVDTGKMQIHEVPDEYRREVRAYVDALQKHGIVVPPESVERIVLNLEANVAGTADRLPMIFPDGTRMVGDVKSGKDLSYSWLAISMQLATYQGASAMLAYHEDGTPYWDAMPVTDEQFGLVMHVPVDKASCHLYLVDLEVGRAALELALEVREMRKRKSIGRPLPLGKYGAPAGPTASAHVHEPPKPVADGADPFAAHPDEAQAGGQDATAEPVPELTPMDEARRWLDKVKALAAEARKARSRRNKAMIRADEQASLAEDGLPTLSVFENAASALIDAYGLTVERTPGVSVSALVPEGTTVVGTFSEGAADAMTPEPYTGAPGTEPQDSGIYDSNGAPIPAGSAAYEEAQRAVTELPESAQDGEPFPAYADVHGGVEADPEILPGLTAHQAVGGQQNGETDEAYALRARQGGVLKLVEAAETPDALASLFSTYSDVWTDFHTQRGQARMAELQRAAQEAAPVTQPEPPAPAADPHDPMVIKAAIDACTNAGDLALVWEAHKDVWTDQMTQYGTSVLAGK